MRYWWVNQNQTYRAEVRGSFMWSPKQNANGARNQFYENMREVSAGDVVFSFCDTHIKAIGVVTGGAQTGPKPDFGAAGSNWSREGWFVPVDYCVLNNQIRPKDHAAILRPFLQRGTHPCRRAETGSSLFTSRSCLRPSLMLSSVSLDRRTGMRTQRSPFFKAPMSRQTSRPRL